MNKFGINIGVFSVCILVLPIISCNSNGSSAGNGSQTPNAGIGTADTTPLSTYCEPESCWIKTTNITQND